MLHYNNKAPRDKEGNNNDTKKIKKFLQNREEVRRQERHLLKETKNAEQVIEKLDSKKVRWKKKNKDKLSHTKKRNNRRYDG